MALIRIDHLHIECDPGKLDLILVNLAQLKEAIMAISQDLQTVLTRIDTATNAIAARLDALAAKISTDMSAEDVAAVQATLTADADRLEAMGKDPANPAPNPAPAPAPTP